MESEPNEKTKVEAKPKKNKKMQWGYVIVAIVFLISGFFIGAPVGKQIGYSEGVAIGMLASDIQHAQLVNHQIQEQQECFSCRGKLYEDIVGERDYHNGTVEPIYGLTCDCDAVIK